MSMVTTPSLEVRNYGAVAGAREFVPRGRHWIHRSLSTRPIRSNLAGGLVAFFIFFKHEWEFLKFSAGSYTINNKRNALDRRLRQLGCSMGRVSHKKDRNLDRPQKT